MKSSICQQRKSFEVKSKYKEGLRLAVTLSLILFAPYGLWFGIKALLRTQYPFHYVASGSMRPTLEVGDLVVIEGVDGSLIRLGSDGDVIVFYEPGYYGDADRLIIHRAIDRIDVQGTICFVTKGDNEATNPAPDLWTRSPYRIPYDFNGRVVLVGGVASRNVVGRLVLGIPYLGYFFMFLNPILKMAATKVLLIAAIVILVAWIAYDSAKGGHLNCRLSLIVDESRPVD